MTKRFFFVLVFLLFSTSLFAQTGWYTLPEKFPAYDQIDVFFMNADTGFVACVNSGLYKTIDGGHNWVRIPSSGNYPRIRYFKNNKLMFQIPGRGGQTLRSIDSGETWETLNLPALGCIDFPTPAIGYALTSNLQESSADTVLYFFSTSDSGKTWAASELVHSNTLLAGQQLKFRDSLHGMLVYQRWVDPYPVFSATGTVTLYTSDGGQNWSELLNAPHEATKILYVGNKWILGNDGEYSMDEGLHWENPTIISPSSKFLGALYYANSGGDTIYTTRDGSFPTVYRSTDGGLSYVELIRPKKMVQGNIFSSAHICEKIASQLPNVGYIVAHSTDTLVFKTTDGGGAPLSVQALASSEELRLSPNPSSNNITLITKSNPIPNTVEIYDALGRTVLYFKIPAFTTSHRIDISHLVSGAYLAKAGSRIMRFVKE
jgi:photosystem II stability/assembly factor-like uncharacterized protein